MLSDTTQCQERSLYLRFVWGRSRLPLRAEDFPKKHKLKLQSTSGKLLRNTLPVAHTCFFSLDLPQYTTKKVRAVLCVVVIGGGGGGVVLLVVGVVLRGRSSWILLRVVGDRQMMRDKILFSITNCQAIDADNTSAARQVRLRCCAQCFTNT